MKTKKTHTVQNEPGRRHNVGAGHPNSAQTVRPSALALLQHGIGNRAMRRLLVQPHNSTLSTIQRDLDEALLGEEMPLAEGAANTGTVTIQPVQNQFYNVTGRTLAEVGAQLDPGEWGRCTYNYTYSFQSTGGRASRVDVTLTLTIRMPRWTGSGWNNASAEAKAEWNRMIAALRAHEDRHAEIARRWASTFKERMINRPAGDLRTIFDQTWAEVNAEQEQYDEQTQHGRTQGVSLDTSIDEPE